MPTTAKPSSADPRISEAQAAEKKAVEEQFARIAPYYARAYRLDTSIPAALKEEAIDRWRRKGDRTLLGAAVAVIQTLDHWREANASDNAAVTKRRAA